MNIVLESKKWLETHMWHTKRMKMVNIWGYRLASRPNTKSARVIYRASTRLSIIHDASYWSCLQLEGELDDIEKVVKTLTDPTASAVASERYNKGNRVGTGYLYQYLSYPKKLISPISFLWKPETKDTLWLWVHPAGRNEALEAIKTAIEKQHVNNKVQFSDLHNEILRFDLTGPRSTALLQAILDPINDTDAGNKVWHALKDLRSSTSLPPGAVIGLTVHDPRLK